MNAEPVDTESLCAMPGYDLGRLIAAVHGKKGTSDLAQWAALLCVHLQEGRVYLDPESPYAGLDVEKVSMPPLEPAPDWLEVVTAGLPASGAKPVVRDGDSLWLARYYDFDSRLRQLVKERRKHSPFVRDEAMLRADLAILFPVTADPGENRGQLLAAANLVDLRFGLLTGGPGTGKTTSLTKLLLLWLRQVEQEEMAPVLLLAPTGKAAARLRASMISAVKKIRDLTAGCAEMDRLLGRLNPEGERCVVKTLTLHRALSVRGSRKEGQGPFRHDQSNPLHASMVIVDEVSMVDLALMTRLVDAVPCETPLFFVGDTEQLESVEAGFVLPKISAVRDELSDTRKKLIAERAGLDPVQRGGENLLCADHVHLTYVHRYKEGSLIGVLARAINDGDADRFINTIQSEEAKVQGLVWLKLPDGGRNLPANNVAREALMGIGGYGELADMLKEATLDSEKAVQAFDKFRILCAIRKGPDGVERWNQRIQQWLTGDVQGPKPQAVMITTNDPVTGLCNGDTGLLLPMDRGLKFCFGEKQTMPAASLPATEPAWAITIHKSQGSEYDAVAIVLPREGGQRLMKRRLLYTAITRARQNLVLLATEKALRTIMTGDASGRG